MSNVDRSALTDEFRTCDSCGAKFFRQYQVSRPAFAKRRFCSRDCFGASRQDDITGVRYGRLVAIRQLPIVKIGVTPWLMRCDCGSEVVVRHSNLKTGNTTSCGCLALESKRERYLTHGHSRRGDKSSEYVIWHLMIQRCENKNSTSWDDYGGRGIAICPRWRNSFAAFLDDVGPRPSAKHSIDRFPDGDGNYEPGNVRWATTTQQARNRRSTRFVEFDGRKLCIEEWVAITGLGRGAIVRRLDLGWSTYDVMMTPRGPDGPRSQARRDVHAAFVASVNLKRTGT